MSIERCKNCEVILEQQPDGSWKHRTSRYIGTQRPCSNPEIGMGLHELIQIYWKEPRLYSSWAHQSQTSPYTPNAILSALRFQATLHWNNCGNSCDKHCQRAAKDHADAYMKELVNGRHDLHPNDDQDVHVLAFEIHDAEVALDPSHGKLGIMTCTYTVGIGYSPCGCYEIAYQRWLAGAAERAERALITVTVIDPDEMHYEPRFD